MSLPPPNSPENIQRVLEGDEHTLSMWSLRALEYLLAEHVKHLEARDAMRAELEQLRQEGERLRAEVYELLRAGDRR